MSRMPPFILVMCVWVHMYACAPVHGGQGQHRLVSFMACHLIFEAESLTEPRAQLLC